MFAATRAQESKPPPERGFGQCGINYRLRREKPSPATTQSCCKSGLAHRIAGATR